MFRFEGSIDDIMAIICHPAIKNDSGAILRSGAEAMAAHRRLDRRRDDLCAGGLRKRAQGLFSGSQF
jgi:hypothetical protein